MGAISPTSRWARLMAGWNTVEKSEIPQIRRSFWGWFYEPLRRSVLRSAPWGWSCSRTASCFYSASRPRAWPSRLPKQFQWRSRTAGLGESALTRRLFLAGGVATLRSVLPPCYQTEQTSANRDELIWLNKPDAPAHTSSRRCRTQVVAGSSPASSMSRSRCTFCVPFGMWAAKADREFGSIAPSRSIEVRS